MPMCFAPLARVWFVPFRIVACVFCDLLCTSSADCSWLKPEELPSKDLLIADQKRLDCETLSHELFNYHPGDNEKLLHRLLRERDNFESTSPHRLRVCSSCHSDLKDILTPIAANQWFLVPCTFHTTNGNMTIKGVVYPPGNPSS